MRSLYVQQKVFKVTDHYPILDENKNPVYHVDQDFKLVGNTVHVKDAEGNPLFTINREIFTFLPRYKVEFVDGREIFLNSRFTFFKQAIDVEAQGQKLFVEGDFLSRSFQVLDGEQVLGSIDRELFRFADVFEMKIHDESKQDLIVAIMIAVDNIIDEQESN